MNQKYNWTNFYMELATALLPYKNKRKELIEILIEVFNGAGMNFPFKENGNIYEDICPFTIFGSFNKGITDINRIRLLTEYAKKFDIKSDVPTEFDGIPVVMNLSAWFFAYKDRRGVYDIDNLWNLFETAINYSEHASEENKQRFILAYDIVIKQKQIKWNITMGLYWIRPFTFLNLDSTNRNMITDGSKIPESLKSVFSDFNPKEVPNGIDYIDICEQAAKILKNNEYSYNNFPELSFYAWKMTKENAVSDRSSSSVDANVQETAYWLYSPGDNAKMWDEFYKFGIMGVGWNEISDLNNFSSKEEIKKEMKIVYDPNKSYKNDAHCLWQFAKEMKQGDIVFVKKGMHKIIGKGVVTSDYIYDSRRSEYPHIRKVDWTNKGEWDHPGQAAMKTLTNISSYSGHVQNLLDIFSEESQKDDEEETEIKYPVYTKDDFLNDVFMSEETYIELASLLENKYNIILQGAPGVGKTYAAKRLAYSIMGEKDSSRVTMVQFHQSYSYEDFIQGFRPSKEGFNLENGAFYRFCKTAEEDNERPYFFIIDEINRGNLSKILGELMMLIEKDKRGDKLKLLYSDEWFSVPNNIRIIGMMNTADRSIAFMDYALRRRFAFFEIEPAFENEGFKRYLEAKNSAKLDQLVSVVKKLNNEISNDESLGEGFMIGHSYFCTDDEISDSWLNATVEYELIPLLKEYWYDEPSKIKEWSLNMRRAIQ